MILLIMSAISISCSARDIDMFFVADLSQQAMMNEEPFFEARLFNDMPSDTHHYILEFRLSSDSYGTLVEGVSAPFAFSGSEIDITSRSIMEQGGDITIDQYAISEGGDELKRILRTTGVLPAGNYMITLSVKDMFGYTLATCSANLRLRNPGNIESIYPGTLVGNPPGVIKTSRPVFQWSSDGDRFKIVVSKVLSDDVTPEEAIEEYPIFAADNITGYTYTYPENAPVLQDGVYAWQITATYISSSGEFQRKSDVYWFQVNTSSNDIVEILKEFFGEDNSFIKDIEDRGMIPTGEITLDNNFITPEQLRKLLQSISKDDIDWVEWR